MMEQKSPESKAKEARACNSLLCVAHGHLWRAAHMEGPWHLCVCLQCSLMLLMQEA